MGSYHVTSVGLIPEVLMFASHARSQDDPTGNTRYLSSCLLPLAIHSSGLASGSSRIGRMLDSLTIMNLVSVAVLCSDNENCRDLLGLYDNRPAGWGRAARGTCLDLNFKWQLRYWTGSQLCCNQVEEMQSGRLQLSETDPRTTTTTTATATATAIATNTALP